MPRVPIDPLKCKSLAAHIAGTVTAPANNLLRTSGLGQVYSDPAKVSYYSEVRDKVWKALLDPFFATNASLEGGAKTTIINITQRDPDFLLTQLNFLRRTKPALYTALESKLRPGINALHLGAQATASQYGTARLLRDRAKRLGLMKGNRPQAMAAIASLAPIEDLRTVAKMAADRREARALRHKEFVDLVYNKLGLGVEESNLVDVLGHGYNDLAHVQRAAREFVDELKPAQTNAILDAWAHIDVGYTRSRASALERWRTQFPEHADWGDERVAKELGLGPTMHAYYAHVFDLDTRSAFIDSLVRDAGAAGMWGNFINEAGLPTTGRKHTLLQILRKIAAADQQAFEINGRAFTSTQKAWEGIFPGFPFEANWPQVERALGSSDDSRALHALIPQIKDKYLMARHGAEGYVWDWWQVFEAVSRSQARATHLGPVFAPGGEMHELLAEIALQDPVLGATFASGIRKVAGVGPTLDAAYRDMQAYTHGAASWAYNAIVRFFPGVALPNALSPFLLTMPEAFRPGLINGAKDIMTAMGILFARGPKGFNHFRSFLDEVGILGTYTSSLEAERAAPLAARLREAARTLDGRAATTVLRESGAKLTDFLTLTETVMVKPFAAAVGAARYLRENNLHHQWMSQLGDYQFRQLNRAQVHDMLQSMTDVMQKSTVLAGSSATVPLQRFMRDIPFFGPVASMFTSMPANILSNMYIGGKSAINPFLPRAMRMQHLRVFSAQVGMGMLVAGPFFAYPLLSREGGLVFSDEDEEELIGFLNWWEKNFSLAGWMDVELAGRLNPVQGVTQRFMGPNYAGSNPIARLLGGPLGDPTADLLRSLFAGDDNPEREGSLRRSLGAAAPLLGLKPSGVLPGILKATLPAGQGLERIFRIILATEADPLGYLSVGPLGFPVKNHHGYQLDGDGRPYAVGSTPSEALKAFGLGGRTASQAQLSAEGRRARQIAAQRDALERKITSSLLDGKTEQALMLMVENRDLNPQIRTSSVQDEATVNRNFLPAARNILSMELQDAVERIQLAAQRLGTGGLSRRQEILERNIVMAGMWRFRNGFQPPRDVALTPDIAAGLLGQNPQSR